jgi:hypothetical protein
MTPNYDGRFHYGVLQANNLDGDVLDQICREGVSAADMAFADALDDAMRALEDFLSPGDIDEVKTLAEELYSQGCCDDDTPITFELEGVRGIYYRNNGTIMITKSPCKTLCRQCSPCYPNAGDLDSYDRLGFDTYCPPEDWWWEFALRPLVVERIKEAANG